MNPTDVIVDVYSTFGMYNHKTTTVRVTHKPSGLYVDSCEGRSQHSNQSIAWAELEKKVAAWEQGKATLDALAKDFEEEIQREAVEQVAIDYETSDYAQSWPFNQLTKQEALDKVSIGFSEEDDYATLRKEFEAWALLFDINTAKTVKYVDEAVEGSWQDFIKSKELY